MKVKQFSFNWKVEKLINTLNYTAISEITESFEKWIENWPEPTSSCASCFTHFESEENIFKAFFSN